MGVNVRAYRIANVRSRSRHRVMFLVAVVVCIFFGVGYLHTRQFFSDNDWSYLLLSLASLLSCLLLLRQLKRSIRYTFPIWILLLVFGVGYFLQFFLLAPGPMAFTGQVVMVRAVDLPVLMKAYITTVLAFLAFCITACWLLARTKQGRRDSSTRATRKTMTPEGAKSLLEWLLVVILPLELILGYIEWAANFAVMGGDNASLPFHLAGMVYYTRTALLPALILLLIWIADHRGLRKYFNLGVALLLAHGVLDALLRSSRSALFFTLLGLFFLLTLTDRFTRRRKQMVIAGILLSLLLFPVITAYRSARLAGNVSALTPALEEGVMAVADKGAFGDLLSDTWFSLIFRVTGLDGLMEMVASNQQPIGLLHVHEVTAVFNNQVMNIPGLVNNSFAPSLVGWFYLVGGNWLVVIGIASFTAGVQLVWEAVRSSNLQSRSIALVLILLLLVYVATDGVLELLPLLVLTTGISAAVLEWLIRRACRHQICIAERVQRHSRLPA
jgi:hypothetical protein